MRLGRVPDTTYMRYCFAVALATGRVSVRHRGSGKGARVLHGPPAGDTREGCVCWRVSRTPSASTVRGATLCCYLSEYVTVTRTVCRVVVGPEAYKINNERRSNAEERRKVA